MARMIAIPEGELLRIYYLLKDAQEEYAEHHGGDGSNGGDKDWKKDLDGMAIEVWNAYQCGRWQE